jgi:hypothetical protein
VPVVPLVLLIPKDPPHLSVRVASGDEVLLKDSLGPFPLPLPDFLTDGDRRIPLTVLWQVEEKGKDRKRMAEKKSEKLYASMGEIPLCHDPSCSARHLWARPAYRDTCPAAKCQRGDSFCTAMLIQTFN